MKRGTGIIIALSIVTLIIMSAASVGWPADPNAAVKQPKPMASFALAPSSVWLDQFRNEPYREVQVYYNLAALREAIVQQQAKIAAMEARIATLEKTVSPTQEPDPEPEKDPNSIPVTQNASN